MLVEIAFIMGGMGLGIVGMLFLFVRPLERQIISMRMAGFDPVKERTMPQSVAPKEDIDEWNET